MGRLISLSGLLILVIIGCEVKQNVSKAPCDYEGYKYYQGKKDTLGEMSHDYLLIGVDSSRSNYEIVNFIKTQRIFETITDSTIRHSPNYRYKYFIAKFVESKNCEEVTYAINTLHNSPIIEFAHYTIQTDNCRNLIGDEMGEKCVLSYSSLFYVEVKSADSLAHLNEVAEETNTQILEQDQLNEKLFTLHANKRSQGDALHMANHFFETGLFEYAEPDIIKIAAEK